ncbi:unnamed protein product [Macrosiphum euphorbiae]|uniref:Uncharacterized protein n=1 Tax=Macrosiphum euphorbiae TaxID=13131 RepID=A0AAV0VLP0_9HEMI|nr:unnamed protein product [Macrosiphum euphorbiae]
MSESYDKQACDQVARCIRYDWESLCPWNVAICRIAGFYSHKDCLVYARENGCPWDEQTCRRAAQNGHINCVIYAQENGCPFGEI